MDRCWLAEIWILFLSLIKKILLDQFHSPANLGATFKNCIRLREGQAFNHKMYEKGVIKSGVG